MIELKSAKQYNREFYPIYKNATHLIYSQIESAIDHAFCKDEESANEIRMQLSIRGWTPELRQFIMDALKFYREAHLDSLKKNCKYE